MPELSVIIPVYNEAATIRSILEKIDKALPVDKEIIVVDDGSIDATGKLLCGIRQLRLKVVHHTTNRGKGAAFLTGLSQAKGEFVIIQDADLEYDPRDYAGLVAEIEEGRADIVLGARFKSGHRGLFIHRLGNKFLSVLLNFLFLVNLNDYATCYKLARRSTFVSMNLKARGFDIDVEIVCRAVKKGLRITELPVAYHPRSYSEGKKIRWDDGLWAMFYIFKYRFGG